MKQPDEVVKGWLAKADSDLTSARTILDGPGPYDTACFHCQQAAEKYMKGFLSSRRKQFPYTHDLDELAALCDAEEPLLGFRTAEIVGLTDYAVRLRYDNSFWPDREEVVAAIATAERVRTAVLSRLCP